MPIICAISICSPRSGYLVPVNVLSSLVGGSCLSIVFDLNYFNLLKLSELSSLPTKTTVALSKDIKLPLTLCKNVYKLQRTPSKRMNILGEKNT